VHSAVVHLQGSTIQVRLSPAESTETTVSGESAEGTTEEGHSTTEELTVADPKEPGPIVPELKELAWGGGSFVVFALLMRFVLFPKVKKGMDARYHSIRGAHESADAERAGARAEVANYEAQLAGIKAEAARVVDGARATLESERQAAVAKVNARIAEQRAAATAQADAARAAVRDQIAAAVGDVAGRAGELATGKRPSAEMVNQVVSEVMAR